MTNFRQRGSTPPQVYREMGTTMHHTWQNINLAVIFTDVWKKTRVNLFSLRKLIGLLKCFRLNLETVTFSIHFVAMYFWQFKKAVVFVSTMSDPLVQFDKSWDSRSLWRCSRRGWKGGDEGVDRTDNARRVERCDWKALGYLRSYSCVDKNTDGGYTWRRHVLANDYSF